jgi:HEAT repeat protein
MTEEKRESEAIMDLIEELSSKDPVIRQRSREELVAIGGHQVTRALVHELIDPRQQVRWEAAKALTAIADPIAAPGLMHALDDKDADVRWVAGEGLIALGGIGLMTVLSGLTKRAESLDFCKAAHHVLHDLKPKGYAKTVEPVLQALETSEPEVTAPPAAYEALVALKS